MGRSEIPTVENGEWRMEIAIWGHIRLRVCFFKERLGTMNPVTNGPRDVPPEIS
jgi:hypothetical protein